MLFCGMFMVYNLPLPSIKNSVPTKTSMDIFSKKYDILQKIIFDNIGTIKALHFDKKLIILNNKKNIINDNMISLVKNTNMDEHNINTIRNIFSSEYLNVLDSIDDFVKYTIYTLDFYNNIMPISLIINSLEYIYLNEKYVDYYYNKPNENHFRQFNDNEFIIELKQQYNVLFDDDKVDDLSLMILNNTNNKMFSHLVAIIKNLNHNLIELDNLNKKLYDCVTDGFLAKKIKGVSLDAILEKYNNIQCDDELDTRNNLLDMIHIKLFNKKFALPSNKTLN